MSDRTVNDKRALIIDDEPDIRLLVKMALEFAGGYEVLVAEDGVSGISLARAERPDVILLDAMLPGMDGLEVCRRLTREEETRGIPVIFLTAKARNVEFEEGIRAGACGCMAKPFDPLRLNTDIDNILNGMNNLDE